MATLTFKETDNSISGRLQTMVSRAIDARAFLQSTILPMYIQDQINRFESENTSETGQWAPLSTKPVKAWWSLPTDERQALASGGYAAQKKIKYSGFPGGGGAINVATGALSNAAIMRGAGGNKIVTQRAITIAIDESVVPYAKYVQAKRQFMTFGAQSKQGFKDAISLYLMGP